MRGRFVVAVALGLEVACGGSRRAGNEKAAEQVATGAAEVEKAADQTSRSGEQKADRIAAGKQPVGQGLQQMAQGPAKAAAFEQLIAALPVLDGWTRSAPKGEQQSMGFSTSRAEATYRQNDSRIEIEILDSALNPIVLAPFTMFMAAGYAERSAEGFKRAATVGVYPGFEEWNSESKHAEVAAVVNDRIIVSGRGDDVAGVTAVRKAVEAVNFGKLATLK